MKPKASTITVPTRFMISRLLGLCLLCISAAVPLHAGVSLPSLFSAHAVLQKSDKVPVWGKATPGERITVEIGGANGSASADSGGKWVAWLDLSHSEPGPHTMIVKGSSTIEIPDVLIGEVWLGSGQSNMEAILQGTTGSKEEIASSANDMLRFFTVKKQAVAAPAEDVEGEWRIADPSTTPYFSATGYYFAKALQKELGQPVGFISASVGGTPIESWLSADALAKDPVLGKVAETMRTTQASFPERIKAYAEGFHKWAEEAGRTDTVDNTPEEFSSPARPPGDWKTVHLPGTFTADGLPDSGIFWLRKELDVPPAMGGIQQPLALGKIVGFFDVYLNGKKVGEVTPDTGSGESVFWVDGNLIRTGANVLAIRNYNPFGNGGIAAPSFHFGTVQLVGDWEVLVEKEFPQLTDAQKSGLQPIPDRIPKPSLVAGYLFDGMIHPLIPYALRGIVWFHGESSVMRAWQYRTALPTMIQDWRQKWGRGDLPFYICQLANFGPKVWVPSESATAELRDAQSQALSLPKTGLAVLIDVGEEADVHFRDKSSVGDRLSRLALKRDYGRGVVDSGPVFKSQTIEENQIRITFSNTDGGLVAKPLPDTYKPRSTSPETQPLKRNSPGGDIEGFAICGPDRKWTWAEARIENDSVVVSAPGIQQPVAVRYAWGNNPTCNLTNGEGLPAAPFRTDDFPLSTLSNKY